MRIWLLSTPGFSKSFCSAESWPRFLSDTRLTVGTSADPTVFLDSLTHKLQNFAFTKHLRRVRHFVLCTII